jgi:hypothetical protein
MFEDQSGPLSPEGQARLEKYGSTLSDNSVRLVVERIADYPEVVAAVREMDDASR